MKPSLHVTVQARAALQFLYPQKLYVHNTNFYGWPCGHTMLASYRICVVIMAACFRRLMEAYACTNACLEIVSPTLNIISSRHTNVHVCIYNYFMY